MFDIVTMMDVACMGVHAKAAAEGRTATAAEYEAEMNKAWEVWLGASVDRDMAAAGFVKTAKGWKKRRWFS
jgi:hypothetical protein